MIVIWEQKRPKRSRRGTLIRRWGKPPYWEVLPDDSGFPVHLHPELIEVLELELEA